MSDVLGQRVREMAEKMAPWLRDVRRRIHRNPELGFRERETASLAAGQLRDLGLDVQAEICQTGVVALLRGHSPGKTVGLRADMDALPILEAAGHEYRSVKDGIMHACGHDAHVTCLLGAARILQRLGDQLAGSVKFIFQPNEEDLPSGALAMVQAGVLQEPAVDVMAALHVDPDLPSGHIGVRAGPFLAQARDFEISILGRSGHGAHPHQGVDAIVIAGHFITQVQSLVSRKVDPLQPAVISIGQIQGGQADNIIAGEVRMKGTLRCLDPQLGDRLVQGLEAVLTGVTESAGARGEVQWSQGCAALVNDGQTIDAVSRSVLRHYGPEFLHQDIPQSMGGDDFSYFLQRVPGALFVLGTNDGTERTSFPLHHPRFDIDESALPAGAAVLALTVLELLSER
jgi:amidohydrolase